MKGPEEFAGSICDTIMSEGLLPADPHRFSPFFLGACEVHPSLNRVHTRSGTLQLEPRIMHVLVCLASRPGQLITREELLQVVWSDVVVGEETLTRAVSRLRALLAQEVPCDKMIETIRGSGYRLIAPVQNEKQAGEPTRVLPAAPPDRVFPWRMTLSAAAVMVLLLLISLPLIQRADRPVQAAFLADIRPQDQPLLTSPLHEECPAISPDGQHLVFSQDKDGVGDFDLFLKPMDVDTCIRLTDSPHKDLYPAWSPDGTFIAFARSGDDGTHAIVRISSSGGAEHVLCTMQRHGVGLDWTPDQQKVVFSAAANWDRASSLYAVDVKSLEVTEVTPANRIQRGVSAYAGDIHPVFSPDGRHLAFARGDDGGRFGLMVITDGGPARRITSGLLNVHGMDWFPDSQALVVSASPSGQALLWKVTLDGHREWLPTSQGGATNPCVDESSDRVVYTQSLMRQDIWAFRFQEAPKVELRATACVSSESQDLFPVMAPDQSALAFVSDRSGTQQLWVALPDGRQARQVSQLPNVQINHPRWNSRGDRIAFSVISSAGIAIHTTDTLGESQKAVCPCQEHQVLLDWTRDPEYLLVDRGTQEKRAFFLIDLQTGKAQPIHIPHEDARVIRVLDNEVYYSRYDHRGIWCVDLFSKQGWKVVPGDAEVRWVSWTATRSGLFFLYHGEQGTEMGLFDGETQAEIWSGVPKPVETDTLYLFKDGEGFLATRYVETRADLYARGLSL